LYDDDYNVFPVVRLAAVTAADVGLVIADVVAADDNKWPLVISGFR